MDEWSILARLKDFEDEKKREMEKNKMKMKQQDVLNMLQQQRFEMEKRKEDQIALTKLMDRKMIDLDKKLADEVK